MAVLVCHSLFFFRVLAHLDASFLGFGSYLALNGSYTTIIFTSYHSAYMYISNLCGLLALEGKALLDLDSIHAAMLKVISETPPSYD